MTSRQKAEGALLATTLIWGSTFVASKIALQSYSPLFGIFLRFTIAASVFYFFLPRGEGWDWQYAKRAFPLGFYLFAGFATQLVGQVYTTASKSAFITGMMVVFVPILQILIERKAPRYGNLVGVALVASGLWLLTAPDGADFNRGDALTVVCAVMFALYIVYLDVISREMTTVQLSFYQSATTAVLALVCMFILEDISYSLSPGPLALLAYLTIMATVVTTFVQTKFQKDTTPTRAVLIFSVEPVFASILAYLILHEQLGAWGILGGGLIIGGVLLSELSESIPGLRTAVQMQSGRRDHGRA